MGLRGPGESQLESDKRIIRKKIAALKKELLQLHRHRSLHRVRREKMVRVCGELMGLGHRLSLLLLNSTHLNTHTPTTGLPRRGPGGVHQLGQVHAAQRAHAGGRAGGGPHVRHARPHHAVRSYLCVVWPAVVGHIGPHPITHLSPNLT